MFFTQIQVCLHFLSSSAICLDFVIIFWLYFFLEWSVKLNDFICLKLSLIHEIVAEIPILQMQLVPEDREGNKSFSRKKHCNSTYNFLKNS